jgi:phosphoribosylanthranilate isomerase
MFVKICGLKTRQQIDKAIEFGYDAIGVVTYPKSRRYCPDPLALELAEHARGKIKRFVVGVKYSDVKQVAAAFDYTQIYEAIPIPHLALASRERPPTDIDYEYFIYDASIGSGVFRPFPKWVGNISGKVIVAGGLAMENIRSVVRDIKPFGVDVSSGVEINGTKDFGLMKEFIDTVRSC